MGKSNKAGKPKGGYISSIRINRIKPAAQTGTRKLACLDLGMWEKYIQPSTKENMVINYQKINTHTYILTCVSFDNLHPQADNPTHIFVVQFTLLL